MLYSIFVTLTLARLAQFPIITYEPGFTGRSHIDDAFKRQGVGIIAGMAFNEARDNHLRAIDARHLFASNMTRLALWRGSFLRS